MKTSWNLELLYKSAKDPRIERDIKTFEKATEVFEKKYKGVAGKPTSAATQAFLKDENKLLAALTEYEKLAAMTESKRAVLYFYFRKDLNSTDQEAESMLNKLSDRLTKAGNKIVFFDLALGKIEPTYRKKFLKSKKLAHYRYMLERTFQTSHYNLSEPEEKILNLKSL